MNWEDQDGAREPHETLLVRKETSDQHSDDHSATSRNPSTSVRSLRLQALQEEDERRK